MIQTSIPSRTRLSAAAFIIAGILFVLYPALRPFSDERSLNGAAAFGSGNWLLAHMMAMVAFTLLPVGLLGFHASIQETSAEQAAWLALLLGMLGAGLTLPFYGGEAYGLNAIGREAIAQQDAALMKLAGIIRSGPGLIMFLVGLLLQAVAAIVAAVSVWRSGLYSKWSGVPLAVGMALYIPQFFGAQSLRVAHGLVVAIGCVWLAGQLWRRSRTE